MEKIWGAFKFILLKFVGIGKIRIKGIRGYIGNGNKIIIKNKSSISLGEKTWISDYCAMVSTGKGIEIGKNCYFNSNVRIFSMDKIQIGDDCLFGPNIVIIDHDHNHIKDRKPFCKQGYTSKEIRIGNNVWIAANCVITKGVEITDNVVIGAGSVVSKSIVQEGIYAGTPAVRIKELQ